MCAGGIAYISLSILLAGCNEKEVQEIKPELENNTIVEDMWAPMYDYTESIEFNNISISAITPCTHMEIVNEELRIFPYFDYDEYILMKSIVLSDNDLYTQAIRIVRDSENFVFNKNRTWFYYSTNGTTIGLYRVDDSTAYYIETSKLPSSYVALVLDELNKNKGEKK